MCDYRISLPTCIWSIVCLSTRQGPQCLQHTMLFDLPRTNHMIYFVFEVKCQRWEAFIRDIKWIKHCPMASTGFLLLNITGMYFRQSDASLDMLIVMFPFTWKVNCTRRRLQDCMTYAKGHSVRCHGNNRNSFHVGKPKINWTAQEAVGQAKRYK